MALGWRDGDLVLCLVVDVSRLFLALAVFFVGCTTPIDREVKKRAFVDGKWVIDGHVSEEVLSAGKRVYVRNCQTCHGREGDGNGSSARYLSPRPRNFQKAKFKFAGIEDRGLPHDDELIRIIKNGLDGSAMKPWDLPDKQIRAVVQYIKTFSKEGKGFDSAKLSIKKPRIPEMPSFDSWAALEANGEKLYHTYFECAKCHPSYVSPEKFTEWETAQRVGSSYLPAPKWSPNYEAVLVPPDFLEHPLRSVRKDQNGYRLDDLYRVVAYGLQGPMPGYGHLGEKDVWAVALYVKRLSDSKKKPEGVALQSQMLRWSSPAPSN